MSIFHTKSLHTFFMESIDTMMMMMMMKSLGYCIIYFSYEAHERYLEDYVRHAISGENA